MIKKMERGKKMEDFCSFVKGALCPFFTSTDRARLEQALFKAFVLSISKVYIHSLDMYV